VVAEASTAEGVGARFGLLLAVCCVAQFMVILDLSIVNVALPSIQSSLGFSSPDLQWVVDAYSITFAGFLLLGGRAADHLGQRRMFVAALLLFALASLAAASRPTAPAGRRPRGQGLAGALMAASSLAIITSSFPPGPKLHRAIGTWAAMNGLGGAAGSCSGDHHPGAQLALDPADQPPIAIAAAAVAYGVVSNRRGRRTARALISPRADLDGRSDGARVRRRGGGPVRLGSSTALVPIVLGVALLVAFG